MKEQKNFQRKTGNFQKKNCSMGDNCLRILKITWHFSFSRTLAFLSIRLVYRPAWWRVATSSGTFPTVGARWTTWSSRASVSPRTRWCSRRFSFLLISDSRFDCITIVFRDFDWPRNGYSAITKCSWRRDICGRRFVVARSELLLFLEKERWLSCLRLGKNDFSFCG